MISRSNRQNYRETGNGTDYTIPSTREEQQGRALKGQGNVLKENSDLGHDRLMHTNKPDIFQDFHVAGLLNTSHDRSIINICL